uniref:Serine carboxypeptidase n=1 Tax=Cucumis sativus TaxID=3659 RepID=A0A0A0LSB6_CUCSA
MAASFSHRCLSFLFLLALPLASATSLDEEQATINYPILQAEKLIRDLNLFPKDSINIAAEEPSFSSSGIVEKSFQFPFIERKKSQGPSVQDLGHHAGYYPLPHTKSARMFYLFFESRNSKKDPVVIWLTGGPGCSSELAMFYENGPFQIANNLSLVWNEYGWDKASNLIYVDQPTGTGFSYTSDDDDIRHDEEGVSNDLYDFLQAFFTEHKEFAANDFYITGESYGFAIGNGLTNPEIQYKAYTDYALEMGLIEKSDFDSINKLVPGCEKAIKTCGANGGSACVTSYVICNQIFNRIMGIVGDKNYYDVRKECIGSLCYDFSNMEKFLNQKSVRSALGVGNMDFVSCSSKVYSAMLMDWMRNLEVGIPALIDDGIKVLVYAGEYDLICNWLGNSRWVHEMNWSGQKAFAASQIVPFLVDGKEAGLLKTHGPLAFIKVHNAGHMVPMDQPKASLQMLQSWMQGKLTLDDTHQKLSPK